MSDQPTSESSTDPGAESVRTRGWKKPVLILGALAIVASVAAISTSGETARATGPRQTHTVTRGDLRVTITEQGTVESSRNLEIKCRIRGGYGGRGGRSVVTWVIPPGSVVAKDDVLVRFDTKVIEETISLGHTDTNNARAALARAEVDASIAETAVDGYLKGTFLSQKQSLQKQLEIAQWNLDTAKKMAADTLSLYRKGFVTKLEVEANNYTVTQARLELDVKKTEIDVHERLTKEMRLETLRGQANATKARLEGRRAGVDLEQSKLDLAEEEFKRCTIQAPRDGLVIYPSAAKWKDTPDIAEGASVHNNQILLLMPDLTQMQVKIGIHESIIGRVSAGLPVTVRLPTGALTSAVSSVASVASPSGWWSGNVVRYETIVELPQDSDLKPGMTADVEVVVAEYKDVLSIPVRAIVQSGDNHYCWVETSGGTERRSITVGDSNDDFIIVDTGVQDGDVVVVDPIGSVQDARDLVSPTEIHVVERGQLIVTLTEQGKLESSNNTEVKCRVRGESTVNWVIESGQQVKAGDELVRLENKQIEEHIHERTKFAHLSRDAAIGFRADATVAGLAVKEYLEGRYKTELMRLEKDLAVARQNLSTATSMLRHVKSMQERGYRSQLDVEEQESAFKQAELDVKIRELDIDVLRNFTKDEEVETLTGNWNAALAAANGHEEVLKMDEARIAQARDELTRCVITAPRDGLVIYPKGQEWKDEPEIAEGSTVHNDQILLLMPDLSRMQVRVGIHETVLDRVSAGLQARVTIPEATLTSKVSSVALVAEPPSWWSGNIVAYDATIPLPETAGLKPGMTAEVEIRLALHDDVLTVPLTAIIEDEDGAWCWVGSPDDARRRRVELGDSNDTSVVITKGLSEGDQVLINPGIFFEVAE